MEEKWALITGATSGIGKQTAIFLAKKKNNLVITGRRADRLKEIKSELEQKYSINVLALCFDLSNRKETESILKEHESELKKVQILINNAGGAMGLSTIQDGSIDDWEQMIDINIKGLLYITRFMLPLMMKHPEGDIINLGSVAGKWVYPNGNVYCATKHAVKALSEALRIDLLGKNIRVTDIEPGMVETEFSIVRLKDEQKAKDVYKGMTPLKAQDIAETIVWCLERPRHVNISELVIFPTDQGAVTMVHRN